jgi:hypothetical protein
MNTIRPNACQLIEKRSVFSDSWGSAIGPSRTDYGDRWQIYHGDFPASLPEAPECVGRSPEKKNPALSRREEETQRPAMSCSERFKLA